MEKGTWSPRVASLLASLRSSREADQERGGLLARKCSLRRRPRALARTPSPAFRLHKNRLLRDFFLYSSTHRPQVCAVLFLFFRSASFDPIFTLIGRFWTWIWSFLCIVVQVWFFVLSIGQEQEMKWKSVFRFRNDFVHSFFLFLFCFLCSFRFVKKCVDLFLE